MAAIECSQCGYSAELPAGYRGWLKCGKCGKPFRVGGGPLLAMLLWLLLFGIVGGGSYLAVAFFKENGQVAVVDPTGKSDDSQTTPPAGPAPVEPTRKDDAEAKRLAEEQARLAEERRKKEEEDRQQRLEEEKRERERREQQAREEEEKRKKEEQAKLELEKLLALKRNPPLTASLEDIEATPDKFTGKYLSIDRVTIKVNAIDRHKDLNRFTIGVTSERGKYFSRVPISGLLVSTGDKLGLELQKSVEASEDYYRFKLFCEVRKWQKKSDATKSYPDVHVYKVEIYSRTGGLTKRLEE